MEHGTDKASDNQVGQPHRAKGNRNPFGHHLQEHFYGYYFTASSRRRRSFLPFRWHPVLRELQQTVLGNQGGQVHGENRFTGARLDRLRDALRADAPDVVLFHSPDRLARKAIYQGLVLEEIEKAGVRVEFLNYPVDDSPESRMLLGMQGLFAEYERAKIMERTRRGKLQRAKEGALVGGHAPFGYRWIKTSEASRASLEKVEYQAAVIRRMYGLLVDEQLSTRAIAKRLTRDGVPTARGAVQWQPTAVFRMLTNPAYKGSYLYRQSGQEAISIPVPSLVDESTWNAAQDQLAQNSLFSRRNNKKQDYLLRGLVRCPRCGGSYTGYVNRGIQRYRCNRISWGSSSTGKRCTAGSVGAQKLDQGVWEAIKNALRNPHIL